MLNINVTARKADGCDITHDHNDGVAKGMYIARLNDNLELCAALRAVYAIAGEDPQVRKIVEEALQNHGA